MPTNKYIHVSICRGVPCLPEVDVIVFIKGIVKAFKGIFHGKNK